MRTHYVRPTDSLRIDLGDGAILTLPVSAVLDMLRELHTPQVDPLDFGCLEMMDFID